MSSAICGCLSGEQAFKKELLSYNTKWPSYNATTKILTSATLTSLATTIKRTMKNIGIIGIKCSNPLNPTKLHYTHAEDSTNTQRTAHTR